MTAETLSVPVAMAELARVYAWADAAADRFGLPPRVRLALQLCCEEAVSNVIRHGYAAPPGAAARIDLTLACTDSAVLLTVEDHGVAFDPTRHAAPAMPACGMVLVNPGVPVATPAVFRARAGGFSPEAVLPAFWPDFPAMAAGLASLGNDLQAPAIALCPEIAEVLAALQVSPGCALARMSGSGATCFGLYPEATSASAAAALLQRPGWWCWGGRVPH